MGMRAAAVVTIVVGLACLGTEASRADQSRAFLGTFELRPQVAQAAVANAPGTVTTRALKDFSDSDRIAVTLYDDSDFNLKLKAEFEQFLRDRNRQVAEADAELLLLIDTATIPTDQVPRGPSLGTAQAGSAGVDVNVNVWSSSQDSVIGGRKKPGSLGVSVFHINALLRYRASGEVVWQGDAYHELVTTDTERIARSMVPLLVDNLGRTVTHEPFEAK